MEPDGVVTGAEVANTPDVDVVEVIVVKPDEAQAAAEVSTSDTPTVGEVVEAVVDAVLGNDDDQPDEEFVVMDPEAVTVEDASVSGDAALDFGPTTEPDTLGVAGVEETVSDVAPGSVSESASAAAETETQVETAEAEAHAAAATEAQQRAEEAVAAGDYETAAQFRETAENEAWEATDSSMLEGSTSAELEGAAAYQAQAEEYEKDEAQHAAAGDYESAREDASHAAEATGWADFKAGGDDHTAQADSEYNKEDWAVWEQQQANEAEQSAETYAAEGEFEAAEIYADSAAEHQAEADTYGQEGEHDSTGGVDTSSDLSDDSYADTSTSYEAPDSSSYDSAESYDSEA